MCISGNILSIQYYQVNSIVVAVHKQQKSLNVVTPTEIRQTTIILYLNRVHADDSIVSWNNL